MLKRRIAGALALGWLTLAALACGLGPSEEEEARNALHELAPRFAPIRNGLARAAAQLPAPGTVVNGPATPLNPPLRAGGPGIEANFEVVDFRQLGSTEIRAGSGEYVWQQRSENDLIDCLRATAPNAGRAERSSFYHADHVRGACEPAARLDYVVAVRAVRYERARITDTAATQFDGGALDLEVFVIRPTTGAIERQLVTCARNDNHIDFRHEHADSVRRAEEAAHDDLIANAELAVREALLATNAAPPTVAPTPPGWQAGTEGAISYAIPPGWARAATTTPFMLVRWQRPGQSDSLPTFYLERRPNDRASVEQILEEIETALRNNGMTLVRRGNARDGAGTEWVDIEARRPPVQSQSALHNWIRITTTRDRQHLIWASCGVPEASTAELGPTCQAILSSVISRP